MMSRSYCTARFVCIRRVGLFLAVCFCLFVLAGVVAQAQPTVTVSSFSGQVMISLHGQTPKVAAVGDVLQAGDVITTLVGAEVVLTFSEGSELHLGEKTKIDIAALTQSQAGARKSNVKLLNGRVRAFLSPGHQKKGSAFTVETPNATAGVKFSHPEVEISYDPETRTTLILAYTVPVIVRNLITKEFASMPKEHQAIVQEEFLWVSPIQPGVKHIPADEQDRLTNTAMLRQFRQIMRGATSPAPVSAGSRAETSQSPGPGSPAPGPRPRTVTIIGSEE